MENREGQRASHPNGAFGELSKVFIRVCLLAFCIISSSRMPLQALKISADIWSTLGGMTTYDSRGLGKCRYRMMLHKEGESLRVRYKSTD